MGEMGPLQGVRQRRDKARLQGTPLLLRGEQTEGQGQMQMV